MLNNVFLTCYYLRVYSQLTHCVVLHEEFLKLEQLTVIGYIDNM